MFNTAICFLFNSKENTDYWYKSYFEEPLYYDQTPENHFFTFSHTIGLS